jgi:hypothetical protein
MTLKAQSLGMPLSFRFLGVSNFRKIQFCLNFENFGG